MRILITGANGYLGGRLVRRYREEHRIYAATHSNLDFTDADEIRRVFNVFEPEIVIHCGAVSDVAACGRDPERSLKVNVYGTQNIAKVCHEFEARMIFCSSDQVYIRHVPEAVDNAFYLPHKEEEILQPAPVYGQHKLMAECFCMEENPDSVILRLSLLYDIPDKGERERGKGMFAENLKKVLAEDLPVEFDPNTFRGITDCKEVSENMKKAWVLPAGIYNFGSTGGDNLYETVREVFRLFGREGLIMRGKGSSPRNLLMDTKKLQEAGIRFRSTLQGLCDYIKDEIHG